MARKFDGEMISADSRQVYKYMDIGTGKDLREYGDIKVWGIDLVEPDYPFNVSEWREYASEVIKDIWKRGKLPVVVGGTALYIKALLKPFETMEIAPNLEIRKRLSGYKIAQLQEELHKIDKEKWETMNESDRENPRRLIRAIEITFSRRGLLRENNQDWLFKASPLILLIGLTAEEEYLKKKISERVERRINEGIGEEILRLHKRGYGTELSSMSGLGYREYPDINLWKLHEGQYAKRQRTFLKKMFKNAEKWGVKTVWYSVSDGQEAFETCLQEATGEVRRIFG